VIQVGLRRDACRGERDDVLPPALRFVGAADAGIPALQEPAGDLLSDFEVLEGGVGAGTLHRFKVTAGGRVREYVMRVDEPEPGRVISETDQNSSVVTTFTVTPAGEDACAVKIETTWNGSGGVGGFFERTFAPRVMRKITPTSWPSSTATHASRLPPEPDRGRAPYSSVAPPS